MGKECEWCKVAAVDLVVVLIVVVVVVVVAVEICSGLQSMARTGRLPRSRLRKRKFRSPLSGCDNSSGTSDETRVLI